jgi:hypothetical protein
MWSRVPTRMELEIRESGTMRASVMAPIMAAAIAIDCTSAFLAGMFLSCPAINRERPRKPSVAASRVLASARASLLPSAARTQPVAGWSLDHGEAGSYLFVRRISTENALVLTDPINSRTVNSEAP